MPLAVVVLSILAVLAFGVRVAGLKGSQDVSQVEAVLRRRWLFKAAQARVLTALETPGDPLRGSLFSVHDVAWTFDGSTVRLRLETEGRKLDINAADPALVRQSVARLLGERFQDAVLPAVNGGPAFDSPAELLRPARRFGTEAEILKRRLTALSGRSDALSDFSAVAPTVGPHEPEGSAEFTAGSFDRGAKGPIRSNYRIVVMQDDVGASTSSQVAQADLYIAINENDPARVAIIHAE